MIMRESHRRRKRSQVDPFSRFKVTRKSVENSGQISHYIRATPHPEELLPTISEKQRYGGKEERKSGDGKGLLYRKHLRFMLTISRILIRRSLRMNTKELCSSGQRPNSDPPTNYSARNEKIQIKICPLLYYTSTLYCKSWTIPFLRDPGMNLEFASVSY